MSTTKQTHGHSFFCIFIGGISVILLWGMMSGKPINSLVFFELDSYRNILGEQAAIKIKCQAENLYQLLLVKSTVQPALLDLSSPGSNQMPLLKTILTAIQQGVNYVFSLLLLCCLRLALVWFFLPCWSLILIATLADAWLIRRIRYHDFHYSSPTLNLWGRRLSQWLPIIMLFSLMLPLSLPTLLFPMLSVMTVICLGWWTTQWQKRV